HTLRYLGIVAVFCLVCVIYLGRLFFIQISGRENEYKSDITEREVTVQAVRGEIYDRNGVKLVANRYSYDLSFAHKQFFSLTEQERNEVCLSVQTALERRGGEGVREQKFFPFDGTYPNYTYSADTLDGDSIRAYRLKRVLGDIGLETDAAATELRDYYTDTYDLLQIDNNGERRFSDKEIDTLIRMYYDIDAVRFRSSGEYILCEGVDMSLMTYIKEQNIKAVNFTVSVEREYCYPGYASHILGLVGPIYSEEWEYYNELGYQMNAIVGKSGCEAAFENYLRGTDGKMRIKEDKNGNVTEVEVLTQAVAGNDVYLTIDINLQIAAEDGLAENVEYVFNQSLGIAENGAECNSGAAVAMNPNTFEVLAIASYPTYDLTTYNADYNLLVQDPARPLTNRAIDGFYAPGSTLKPGMAAIALTDGVLSSWEDITCTGRYKNTIGCSTYSDTHSWGSIDVIDAIAYSCNSFFCELGYRLDIQKMENYLSLFGLGQSTGLELGGGKGILAGPTYRGQIQSTEKWQPGMTWSAAIGQSDHQLSPVQMACYIGTLCNGGTRYTAHLLHSVYRFGSDEPSFVYQQTEDTVLSRIELDEDDLDTVFAGMKKMITETNFTNRWIANNDDIPVTVGGKTGTAQRGGDNPDNALFVATAPYNDPDIVISVVLEDGAHGYYSAITAARILEAYYNE
ncbi:MAG: hypothetical protein E7584_02190, partial [Ruminococcaceae bacterium]|nr:hypothetical protein [Oscillospiraceae bacterium]